MLKEIAISICAAGMILSIAAAIEAGLEKQDRITCQKLQQQAIDYEPIFYATEAENKMCNDLGMPIK